MTRRKARPPAQLANIQKNFSDILGETHFEELAALARLRQGWPHIVGPMLAQRTEPAHLEFTEKGKILWVAVYHSTLAQQIVFLRDDIRKACSRETGLHGIINIRTRVNAKAGVPLPKVRKPLPPLSLGQCKAVAKTLQSIKDKSLRRVMFQARIAQLQRIQADI